MILSCPNCLTRSALGSIETGGALAWIDEAPQVLIPGNIATFRSIVLPAGANAARRKAPTSNNRSDRNRGGHLRVDGDHQGPAARNPGNTGRRGVRSRCRNACHATRTKIGSRQGVDRRRRAERPPTVQPRLPEPSFGVAGHAASGQPEVIGVRRRGGRGRNAAPARRAINRTRTWSEAADSGRPTTPATDARRERAREGGGPDRPSLPGSGGHGTGQDCRSGRLVVPG